MKKERGGRKEREKERVWDRILAISSIIVIAL
jgi:hypothetical protein